MSLTIRPVTPDDRAAWQMLWTGYLEFYESAVAEEVYQATFARLLPGGSETMRGLIAEKDGAPLGLVHYIFHDHCWKPEGVVYLQDLFVTKEARGTGAGRALIEAAIESRKPGFDYANIGYNLYGAILETATGKAWQDWLAEDVFTPLAFEHTSARTSDFPLESQSWNHIWTGDETGWFEVRPKTDGQMQSAGGMTMSPNDMISWLQFNLQGEGPNGSGLTAEIVDTYLTSAVERDRDPRNDYELPCYGYSLGWNLCDFEGHELFIHGGGFMVGAAVLLGLKPVER